MAEEPDEDSLLNTPNRGIIVVLLMVGTLMQSLDSTIANVALPYMQGSLSASYDQVTWVLTSYVLAAAIMTGPVGWLTGRFGRKNFLIGCLVGFTASSMLCGTAASLTQIVLYRLIQGAFGAALVPLAQSIMLDIYPPEKRGGAMALWSMGVMVGPILGPTLGGYLTDYYNWRFVFFVNLPFGIITVLGLLFFLPAKGRRSKTGFDWTGFLVLSLGLGAMQIGLDRGEDLDWFSSNTIILCAFLSVIGYYLFLVHMLTAKTPFIPRAAFGDLNFNVGLLTMLSVGMVTLSTSALQAPYLENLQNYPVAAAGLVMAPRGAGIMLGMLFAGRLSDRMDPRIIMFVGYILVGASIYMMEGWTPAISQRSMMLAIVTQGLGLGFVFLPLQVVAFYTIAPQLRTQASALLSLVRNVSNAIGISITSALLDRQTHYEHAVLTQYVTPFARPLQAGGAVSRMLNPHSPSGASLLETMINTQAQIIAYIDDYKLLFLATVPATLCLFIIRRPVSAKAPAPAAVTP